MTNHCTICCNHNKVLYYTFQSVTLSLWHYSKPKYICGLVCDVIIACLRWGDSRNDPPSDEEGLHLLRSAAATAVSQPSGATVYQQRPHSIAGEAGPDHLHNRSCEESQRLTAAESSAELVSRHAKLFPAGRKRRVVNSPTITAEAIFFHYLKNYDNK